ncbi:FAD/NAD(P)-binding protein [Desulfonatronospira sp.]|uniref:FAD/NAD(P)-binding protein n=1 Tax=Desulfonatronospira sp. TaxID=1962951 RepID=UPI0025BD1E4C|nr:FAD/NAD(P)-binding protein [Desulfonatronospira sp.]
MKHNIVIIGAGPRGTYCLRRLSLALSANSPENQVNIHVVEKSGKFGGGNVHNVNQPHYLLLNTVSCQITAFGDDDAEARARESRKTLYGYLQEKGYSYGQNDYPPRALHGEYLAACFDWTEANFPENVRLHRHVAEAVDIDPAPDGLQVVLLDNGERIYAQEVVLLTGHSKNRIVPGSLEDRLNKFAEAGQQKGDNISYVHLAYPIASKLEHIQPHETVYVIGMGLTATDVVRGFTHGRSGEFRSGRYLPSGKEPHIILGSRLGLPYCARGINQKTEQYQARIFTRELVHRLKQKGKLDFRDELFPLILQEMEYVYYKTLKGEDFGRAYLNCRDATQRAALVQKEIEHHERFDWQYLENPLSRLESARKPGETLFDSMAHYTDFVLQEIRHDIEEAKKGNMDSPVKNAVDSVLRDLRDTLRNAVDHGGLTAASHRYMKKTFERTNNRVAVGPPIESVQELWSLVRQGLVSFSGPSPEIRMDQEKGLFEVSSPEVPGSRRIVHHVVNGRIHGVDNKNDTSALIRNLLQRGMARTYTNSDNTGSFEMGGLDITQDYQLVAEDGGINEHICALGIPVEGKVWFNAADARPDVNSNAITQLSNWAGDAVKRIHHREQAGVQTVQEEV